MATPHYSIIFQSLYLINLQLRQHQSIVVVKIELSKRYLIHTNKRTLNANDIYDELKEYITKSQEYFLNITLDVASHIINKRVVFIGTLNQSLVHPHEVFSDAISDRVAGVIITHNSPAKPI